MGKILTTISILTIPIILILFTLDIVAFNEKYYPKAFKKYDIYNTIDTTQEEIDAQAVNILHYIQSEEPLAGTLLHEKEKVHLQDVQKLVTRGQQLLLMAVFLFLATWIPASNKRKIILYGALLTLVVIGVFALVNFSDLFLLFHRVAFTNDFWLLNPVTDNLIKMYPEGIFYDLIKRIAITTSVICGMIIVTSKIRKIKDN